MDNSKKEISYLVKNPDFPYCPGCGHTLIVRALDSALRKTGKGPKYINLITDIGCVGLVDKLFLTNTVHTTHGRSTAIATGLQLADEILFDGKVIHIVMIGDGGATIGISHLIEAAKMNTNITVILHNNFLYGMTGGQHSGLTPVDFHTATTMQGNLLPPLRIGDIMIAAHSGFYSRILATDHNLDEEIYKAITYQGFALIEVIELCTGYATKWNKLTKKDIHEILEKMNCGQTGTLVERKDRETYGSIYKKSLPMKGKKETPQTIEVKGTIEKEIYCSIILAGSAGEGVQSSSRVLCQAGVANGLNVIQQNDNPITIGTGYSMSEFIFSSKEIYYSAITNPDYLIVTSEDGLIRIKELIGKLTETNLLILDSSIAIPETKAKILHKPIRKTARNKRVCNLIALGYLLTHIQDVPLELFIFSIKKLGRNVDNSIEAVKTGYEMR